MQNWCQVNPLYLHSNTLNKEFLHNNFNDRIPQNTHIFLCMLSILSVVCVNTSNQSTKSAICSSEHSILACVMLWPKWFGLMSQHWNRNNICWHFIKYIPFWCELSPRSKSIKNWCYAHYRLYGLHLLVGKSYHCPIAVTLIRADLRCQQNSTTAKNTVDKLT